MKSDKIVGRPIRLNRQTLICKPNKNYAEVVFIGDVHFGSPQFDKPRFVEHKKTLLITGSYLKYDGGYAQTVGLPISKLGSPKIKFCADTKDIFVSW